MLRLMFGFILSSALIAGAPAHAAVIMRHSDASSLLGVINLGISEAFDDATLAPGLAASGSISIRDGKLENAVYAPSRITTLSFADGVYGFGTDIGISAISRTNLLHVVATFADSTSMTIADLGGPSQSFFGFSSDTKISSLTFTSLRGGEVYFNLDNVVAGNLPAVPEPASWAMMVLGFGAIGGALRSRRPNPTVSSIA